MSRITEQQIKQIIEAAIFVAPSPITVSELKQKLFSDQSVSTKLINQAIADLTQEYSERGIQLVKLANGYRFQTNSTLSKYLSNLYNEKAPKLSQALMETLAIIAYKQPITRSEIEQLRGVAVSSNIIKTLTERHWVKVVGHKDVPGKPAMLGTTAEFLNYFSLTSLAQLPEIMPIADSAAMPESFSEIETEA